MVDNVLLCLGSDSWVVDSDKADEEDSKDDREDLVSWEFISSFSSYSSNLASSSTSMDFRPSDFMDQLKNYLEMRFHATWLFLRYFYLTMSPDINTGNARSYCANPV